MKLYTINPLYTSLYLLIVFAVYVSSIELFVLDGREYLNYKYEIIFGGPKVLMNIEGATFGGVKRVRPLSPDEILELKEKRSKQKEIERKQVEEKRQREQGEKERDQEEKEKKKKGEEEEIKRKYRSRQEEIKIGQQQRKTQRIKEQKERDAKKALREAKTVKPNAKQQIRRTLSNKQNTPLNRLSRRNNING